MNTARRVLLVLTGFPALTKVSVHIQQVDRVRLMVPKRMSARSVITVLTFWQARVRRMALTNSKARDVNKVLTNDMARSALTVLTPWWLADSSWFSCLARLTQSGRLSEICWLALARWFTTNSTALITVWFSIDKWITRFLGFTVSRRFAVDRWFSALHWLANVTRSDRHSHFGSLRIKVL